MKLLVIVISFSLFLFANAAKATHLFYNLTDSDTRDDFTRSEIDPKDENKTLRGNAKDIFVIIC
jgi:hypothetical protein